MKAWKDLGRLPKQIWILGFASLINRMGTMAFPFLTLYLTSQRGFSAAQAGATLALFGASAFAVGPLAGLASDRWNPVRIMKSGLISSALVLMLFPLAKNFYAILAMVAIWAITAETARPAGLTAFSIYAPESMRKQTFAFQRLCVNLGMSVGPAVGGFLAAFSYPTLYVVNGATTVLAAAALYLADFKSTQTTSEKHDQPTSHPLTNKRLLLVLAGLLPTTMVFFQHESSMPLYLVGHLGFKPSFYGLIFTVNTLLIVTLEIPLNHATSHWSARRTLTLGALLVALGFGAMAFARSMSGVLFTGVIWTFGEMILFPGMSAYISEIAPPRLRGAYMGLYTTTFSAAFMVGPWAGTIALEKFGPTFLWLSCGALGFFAASLFAQVYTDRYNS